mmetsp:Transcript_36514/g.51615  ORF Transcript_36514/g.51615 Transcript_36514/m.51615 type:complete len:135 (+) Transcript_36514:88-492(+)
MAEPQQNKITTSCNHKKELINIIKSQLDKIKNQTPDSPMNTTEDQTKWPSMTSPQTKQYQKTKNILGLGTKFCITTMKPDYHWIKTTQQRLTKQIRLHTHLPPLTEPQLKLYRPSDYKPPRADSYTEAHVKQFR